MSEICLREEHSNFYIKRKDGKQMIFYNDNNLNNLNNLISKWWNDIRNIGVVLGKFDYYTIV